jgi:hypothetical protein
VFRDRYLKQKVEQTRQFTTWKLQFKKNSEHKVQILDIKYKVSLPVFRERYLKQKVEKIAKTVYNIDVIS